MSGTTLLSNRPAATEPRTRRRQTSSSDHERPGEWDDGGRTAEVKGDSASSACFWLVLSGPDSEPKYTRQESNPVPIPKESQGISPSPPEAVRDPVQSVTEGWLRDLVARLTPDQRAFLLQLLTSHHSGR